MFVSRSEYDHGVNTYSPEGRLFQVEYAIESIKLGSTAIGIKTKEGVVLAVEKRLTSKLIVPSSVVKIQEIDTHIGCAMSGLVADATTLIDNARSLITNYHFVYNDSMKVEAVAQSIADIMLSFSDDDDDDTKMSRPFGVALLFGGWSKDKGYQLYCCDPSGTSTYYKCISIGSGSEGAMAILKEQYNDDLTLEKGKDISVQILKQVMRDEITADNIDICTITEKEGYKLYNTDEIKQELAKL
ncbi:hypothetical protein WA158_002417 [Blastocystis sp. Blastoise]